MESMMARVAPMRTRSTRSHLSRARYFLHPPTRCQSCGTRWQHMVALSSGTCWASALAWSLCHVVHAGLPFWPPPLAVMWYMLLLRAAVVWYTPSFAFLGHNLMWYMGCRLGRLGHNLVWYTGCRLDSVGAAPTAAFFRGPTVGGSPIIPGREVSWSGDH